jgi:DNA-binding response OmpR family regulator
VYRYRSAQDDLVREAGSGRHAGMEERTVLRADATSPEGRALVTRQPVICNALCEAIGSDRPSAAIAGNSISTVDVIVKGVDGEPYGVLGASNDLRQAYDRNDVEFLSGIANILAGAIANSERTEILNQTIMRLQVAAGKGNRLSEPAQDLIEVPPAWATHSGAVGKIEIGGSKANAPLIARTATTNGPGRRVLIVEDDLVARDLLVEHFAAAGGFTVFTAATLAEADKALLDNHRHFDTILLDVGLPDGDGCDYCAKLRRERHAMPIIMLTGANKVGDVVRGLESGADDYIAKPFRWNELLARVRAQVRMLDSSEASVFAIGPYLFRPAKKLLEDRGRNGHIQLTGTEVALLRFLYHQSPAVVDRERLTNEIWGQNSNVTTHALDTHIYRLRQKMEANPGTPALLLLERGGYRLNLATVAA